MGPPRRRRRPGSAGDAARSRSAAAPRSGPVSTAGVQPAMSSSAESTPAVKPQTSMPAHLERGADPAARMADPQPVGRVDQLGDRQPGDVRDLGRLARRAPGAARATRPSTGVTTKSLTGIHSVGQLRQHGDAGRVEPDLLAAPRAARSPPGRRRPGRPRRRGRPAGRRGCAWSRRAAAPARRGRAPGSSPSSTSTALARPPLVGVRRRVKSSVRADARPGSAAARTRRQSRPADAPLTAGTATPRCCSTRRGERRRRRARRRCRRAGSGPGRRRRR